MGFFLDDSLDWVLRGTLGDLGDFAKNFHQHGLLGSIVGHDVADLQDGKRHLVDLAELVHPHTVVVGVLETEVSLRRWLLLYERLFHLELARTLLVRSLEYLDIFLEVSLLLQVTVDPAKSYLFLML